MAHVIDLTKGPGKTPPDKKKGGAINWRRRQALQIAAQLPDNLQEALEVLDDTRRLVRFLAR